MHEETELRRTQAIRDLQAATYALRDEDWDTAQRRAQDALLIMESTPARDKLPAAPEEPELDHSWRGELTDMDNPLNRPAREY